MVGTSTLVEASVGLQAGGQTYRQIIFFQDAEAYQAFAKDGFEFDAQAQAVAEVRETMRALMAQQASDRARARKKKG